MKKKNRVARKIFLLLFAISGFTFYANAQITIGSNQPPHEDALLDLKENSDGSSTKGIIFPRLELKATNSSLPLSSHVKGMTVYNLKAAGTGATQVYQGLYYNDGNSWIRLVPQNTVFFYAPSIVVPTEDTDPAYNAGTDSFTLDLYTIYNNQFGMTDPTSSVQSPDGGSLPVLAKEQLGYFVTYFDKAVFSNVTINNDGILTYKLIPGYSVTENTFMNVVFKIK